MRVSKFLVAAACTAAMACGGKVPGGGSMPGGGGLPGGGAVPGGLGGSSGEVDPNTCGNYAASDAGAKLKVFLQSVKDLQKATNDTVRVIKESCVTMGDKLGMNKDELEGMTDTNAVCAKVITAYQDNLKVSMGAKAKLKIKYAPAKCTVDANASASASGACAGGASASSGGGASGGGQCAAAAQANASINAKCEPPTLDISFQAKAAVDATKAQMTVDAMKAGLPDLFSAAARLAAMKGAAAAVESSAKDLVGMGAKFAQSFQDQALCITGQLTAAASAAANIQANVSVSVSVSASASGSVAGGG